MAFQKASCIMFLRMFALNAVSLSVDLVYAVENAYFIPVVYSRGLSLTESGLLLAASPLVGVVLQGYVGSASDHCKCSWGRRRPFIVGFTVSVVIGLSLFPLIDDIGDHVKVSYWHTVVIYILVLLSTFLTEFSIGTMQSPFRAYILDVLPEENVKVGNIIYSIMLSIGAIVGYVICTIDWAEIFYSSDDIDVQTKFVCYFAVVGVALCTLITSCSFKERNPRAGYEEIVDKEEVETRTCRCSCCAMFYESLKGTFLFMKNMSNPMLILCMASYFTLLGMFNEGYYFTLYVAEVVFDGDSTPSDNSTAYTEYLNGVQYGSLALGVGAVVALFVSLLLAPIMKVIGMKLTFLFTSALLTVQSGILIFAKNKIAVLVLAPAYYITVAVILNIPFVIVSMYDARGLLLRRRLDNTETSLLGRACGMINMSVLCAQATALISSGALIDYYESPVVTMMFTCTAAFLGTAISFFLTIPREE